jgi:hypothetical protein
VSYPGQSKPSPYHCHLFINLTYNTFLLQCNLNYILDQLEEETDTCDERATSEENGLYILVGKHSIELVNINIYRILIEQLNRYYAVDVCV